MKTLKLVIICGIYSLAFACTDAARTNVTSPTTPSPTASLPAATPAEVVTGKSLYIDNCAVCHKENGTGGKMEIEGKQIDPDDLTSSKIKAFSDEKIRGYIVNGVEDEGMPAFKDKLNETQIREIISYVRSEIQKKTDRL